MSLLWGMMLWALVIVVGNIGLAAVLYVYREDTWIRFGRWLRSRYQHQHGGKP